jgi:two-component system response regulator PilR (NtrC family)
LELPEEGCQLDEVMTEVERRFVVQALQRTGGVRKAAAELLGISFRSMRYRLEKHALDLGDRDTEPDEGEPDALGE